MYTNRFWLVTGYLFGLKIIIKTCFCTLVARRMFGIDMGQNLSVENLENVFFYDEGVLGYPADNSSRVKFQFVSVKFLNFCSMLFVNTVELP